MAGVSMARRRQRTTAALTVLAALGLTSVLLNPSPSAGAVDCNASGAAEPDDVELALRVAIGIRPLAECKALDKNSDGILSVDETVAAAPNEVMQRYWRAALQPLSGPGDVIMRNAQITASYATYYKRRSDLFKWAGCAAFVSYQLWPPLVGFKPQVLNRRIFDAKALEEGPAPVQHDLDLLRVTNVAVFQDIAWAHTAYLDGGLSAVEAGTEGLPNHELLVEGFREIARGEKLLAADRRSYEGKDAVWRGNTTLLRHEQAGIIQEQLGKMNDAVAMMMWWLSIDFDANNLKSDQATQASFAAAMTRRNRPDGKVNNFDDRWTWIEDEILPQWRKTDERGVMNEIDVLIQEPKHSYKKK